MVAGISGTIAKQIVHHLIAKDTGNGPNKLADDERSDTHVWKQPETLTMGNLEILCSPQVWRGLPFSGVSPVGPSAGRLGGA